MKTLLLSLLLSVISLTIKSQTYYIVRHAEKATSAAGMGSQDNPPLTEAGMQRALALKEFLKDKNIGYIFSTNTLRTTATAKPLSDVIGVNIITYKKVDQALIDTVKSLHKNTLIVGHSNTVDDIVNLLSNKENVSGDLADSQYDNLYVVTIDGATITFKALKYGL